MNWRLNEIINIHRLTGCWRENKMKKEIWKIVRIVRFIWMGRRRRVKYCIIHNTHSRIASRDKQSLFISTWFHVCSCMRHLWRVCVCVRAIVAARRNKNDNNNMKEHFLCDRFHSILFCVLRGPCATCDRRQLCQNTISLALAAQRLCPQLVCHAICFISGTLAVLYLFIASEPTDAPRFNNKNEWKRNGEGDEIILGRVVCCCRMHAYASFDSVHQRNRVLSARDYWLNRRE